MIDLTHASSIGPLITNDETVVRLPADLQSLLLDANGFVIFDGGLHVRGICDAPDWHSLERFWIGEYALWRLYPTVRPDDVPFAQDFLGDQFLLRRGRVIHLDGEIGSIDEVGLGLNEFLESAFTNPDDCR